MVATPYLPEPLRIEFLPRAHDEKNGVWPRKCWIKVVLRSSYSAWHLKIAFMALLRTTSTQPLEGDQKDEKICRTSAAVLTVAEYDFWMTQ